MTQLGQLLKSPARIDILRSLFLWGEAIGIRPLASIAGTHPYATSRALKELVEEGLVEKSGTKARPLYSLRVEHPEFSRLQCVFEADRNERRRLDGESLSQRAMAFMTFNRQVLQMMRTARSSLHGTE